MRIEHNWKHNWVGFVTMQYPFVGEVRYLPNDGSVMVGCPHCDIVRQRDQMIPRGLVDFVSWGLFRPFGERKITFKQDASSGAEIIGREKSRHAGMIALRLENGLGARCTTLVSFLTQNCGRDFHFAGPLPPSPFIGRERELDWLRSRLGRARRSVADDFLWIVGEAGIGKTALLAQFLEHYTEERSVVWFNCAEWAKETPDFRSVFDGLSELSRIIVVFDGAEAVSEVKLVQLYMAARNRKAVETVIFTSRLEVKLRGRHEQLVLTRMPEFDAEALLRAKLRLNDLDETSALRLAAVVNGNPEAMSIVAAMAQSMSSDQLRRVLSGKIYDADEA